MKNVIIKNRKNKLIKLIACYPYLLIIGAILGFIFIFMLKGFDLAVRSLFYVIPILLASAILLRKEKQIFKNQYFINSKISLFNLVLIYFLLFLISLLLLMLNETRPIYYFLIIAFITGLIFYQIIITRPNWSKSLIFFEIMLLSLNIIWGVNLKYPLFFGLTDTLQHLHLIDIIVNTAHISSEDINYQYFPFFHINNAVGCLITQLSVKYSLFIFMGMTWQVGILFCYLIFKKLLKSEYIALLAILLFTFSSELVYYGTYAITRSLGFVLFLIWLYLIINRQKPKYLVLSLIIMFSLVMTHHTTVLFIIPILLLIYFCEFLLSKHQNHNYSFKAIFLLSVSFIGYLFFPAIIFTQIALVDRLNRILPSDTVVHINNELIYKPLFIPNYLYDSIELFLCLLGIGIIFKFILQNKKYKSIYGIAISCVLLLILSLPGPLSFIIPKYQELMGYRFPLIVSPFIFLLIVFGVIKLLDLEYFLQNKLINKYIFPLFTFTIITSSVLFSMIYHSQDYPYLPYPKTANSEYFTKAELEAYSHLNKNADNSHKLYGDIETINNNYTLYNFLNYEILYKKVLEKGADISYIQDGYIILRYDELKKSGGLNFYKDNNDFRYYDIQANSYPDIQIELSLKDRIFSNHDIQIYFVQENKN